jgi:hypothetical protein
VTPQVTTKEKVVKRWSCFHADYKYSKAFSPVLIWLWTTRPLSKQTTWFSCADSNFPFFYYRWILRREGWYGFVDSCNKKREVSRLSHKVLQYRRRASSTRPVESCLRSQWHRHFAWSLSHVNCRSQGFSPSQNRWLRCAMNPKNLQLKSIQWLMHFIPSE